MDSDAKTTSSNAS